MKYSDLTLKKNKSAKRVGRGIAAGQGKTAGRGTKGQNSRTGSSRKPGFEGGQNPLMQKLPKLHGFTSHKVGMEVVYTGQLETINGKTIDNAVLAAAGLVSNAHVSVKMIVRGEVISAKNVKLQSASKQAITALEKAGGNFTTVERVGRLTTAAKGSRRSKKANE